MNELPLLLVVEDEEAIAEGLAVNLRNKGYRVDLAGDGREALKKAGAKSYDLILLDIRIPEVDGFEVCRLLRLAGNPAPIIFLSARTSPDDIVYGLKIGGDSYITKPFDLAELLAHIEAHLRRGEWSKAALMKVTTAVARTVRRGEREYQIALSFAGKDRTTAESVARELVSRGVRVFYDEFEKATLWGKNLYDYLAWIYTESADFCLVFLSEAYAMNVWTSHERKSAQERAFKENREYILPVRLDDTTIPGVPDTIGYVDLRHTTKSELCELVLDKLKISRAQIDYGAEFGTGRQNPGES